MRSSAINYHTYSFPVSHQSRHHSHQQSYTARGCKCSGCCHSGNGTASHTGFPLRMNRNSQSQENRSADKKKSMLFWAGQLLCVLDFLQQRWSSSSELSPQSLSPSHFQWVWTQTWFLHSNRKVGQYVPLGKRVAESKNHSRVCNQVQNSQS